MSSTNRTSIGYIAEATPGTTPATPDFQLLPTTGGSPSANLSTAVSEVIRSDRQIDDLVIVDSEIAGSMNFELSYAPYKPIIESLLRGVLNTIAVAAATDIAATATSFTGTTTDFLTNDFRVGDYFVIGGFTDGTIDGVYRVETVAQYEITTFPAPTTTESAAASIDIDALATRNGIEDMTTYSFRKMIEGLASTAYFYYRGCAISQMVLNFATGSILNGSFDISGRTEEATETQISGESETVVPDYSILNAVDNIIDISIEGLTATTCFQDLNLTITNNTTAKKCIGTLGASDLVDYGNDVSGDVNLYFEDLVAYNKFKDAESFSIAITLKDGDDNYLIIYMPNCKFESLEQPIDGKDNFLMLSGSFRALRDSTTDMQIQFTFVPV